MGDAKSNMIAVTSILVRHEKTKSGTAKRKIRDLENADRFRVSFVMGSIGQDEKLSHSHRMAE